MSAIRSALLMQAFANYSVLLRDELGWSASMLSIGFALTRVQTALLAPIQGWLLDRFGPRVVMRVGVVIFGIGFMLFSQMRTPLEFFGFYLLVVLGSTLSGMLSITTTIVNWFEHRRATALSLAQVGIAAGGVLTPIVAYALTTIGWRTTAFASGVIVLVVGLPIAQVMHHRPELLGEHVDGVTPEQRRAEAERNGVRDEPQRSLTVREALRTRAFWLIGFGHASALLVVGAVMLHLSLDLTGSLGLTLQQASFVGGALPLMQLTGQLIGGYLGDRFNKRRIIIVCMLGHMVGLLLLAYAVNIWMAILFVPLHGLAWGIRGPQMQALRADYFGRASFGMIMGFSTMLNMIGLMSGPLIAGFLADATGGYQAGFTIIAVLAGLGSLFFYFATPPETPGDADDGARARSGAAAAGVPGL